MDRADHIDAEERSPTGVPDGEITPVSASGTSLLTSILIGGVRLYQWTLSHWLGGRCRFVPSCSEYFIGAVQKDGAVKGSAKGLWRICRCHPWGGHGYDPP
ncbi:membrane protein insertion efficiency factor YidD [Planctomicrobium sp. SH664]|uniref:membrane protein insertion efficiency factor YidD n=1 Tax=Planctomicrobium sp. SH664 TaxID=3448125 RepID=UPI003F5B4F00